MMTKREVLGIIKDAMAHNPDVVAYCDNEIGLIQRKADKARALAATKKAAGDELTDAVRQAMSSTQFETVGTIAERIMGPDLTLAKIAYRLNALSKSGVAEKGSISVPAEDSGRARKLVAYKLK